MITRRAFQELMRRRNLLLDGGYGSSFFEMGFGNTPVEVLNLEHPESVEKLHRLYVEAGADVLLTNTFGGNRPKLTENSLDFRFNGLNN